MDDNLHYKDTRTGRIYWDTARKLEFLTVGDYGKENNIKANFLGLTNEINGVEHHDVDLHDKWVATISTQKGCPCRCRFCDVPKFGFFGNATMDDLEYQITTILADNMGVGRTKRFNVHFARMGEPTYNFNVVRFTNLYLRDIIERRLEAETVHPVVSTMMPRGNSNLENFLHEWCLLKNKVYHGEAGLQLSINSTDDDQRSWQFRGRSLGLASVSRIASELPDPVGRKYTLNFAVTKDTILDAAKLSDLFDPKRFIVKITPIHETANAAENGFDKTTTYEDYDVYRKFEDPLLAKGWDVIVFVPSKEEDADRITCGNALIADGLERK